MVLLAGVGWWGALTATTGSHAAALGAAGIGVATVAVVWWRGGRRAGQTAVAALVVFVAVATAAGVRAERVAANPLTRLALTRAGVTLEGTVTDDPRRLAARFGDEALVRISVMKVVCGAEVMRLRQPVVVFAPTTWLGVPLGASVRVDGHLAPTTEGDVAATLSTHDPPEVTSAPDPWWRASGQVRAALRQSVSQASVRPSRAGPGPGGR